ncbi:MAG: hypothetical protein K6G36_00950 [Candidatus Saccharibacteria bacterium]|nr:hypothetical protein [Candidatus Saccharibacteria bacterium]
MKTIKISPFRAGFDYERVGLTKEFFDGYVERRLSTEQKLQRSSMRSYDYIDAELIPDPQAVFLGKCRKLSALVDRGYIDDPDKVWQAMQEAGYVRPDFDWEQAVGSITKAIAPNFRWAYAVLSKQHTYDCGPVDSFIDKNYERLKETVEVNQDVLSAEIAKLLPPAQAAMLGWIRESGASYNLNGVLERYALMELEEYVNEDGQSNNCNKIVYELSEQERQVLGALYWNLFQLVQRTEFQRILERAVS